MSMPDQPVQRMAPAPKLVSVTDNTRHAPPPPSPAEAPVALPQSAAEAPVEVSYTPTVPLDGPFGEILDRLNEQQRLISQVHQAFLEAQANLHMQYMSLGFTGRQQVLDQVYGAPAGAEVAEPTAAWGATAAPAWTPTSAPTPAAPHVHADVEPHLAAASLAVVHAQASLNLDREALIKLSRGAAAPLGADFERRVGADLAVRPPAPPLLMLDRVLDLDGVAGSQGAGRIVAEIDLTEDAWYMGREGRVAGGLFLEGTQALAVAVAWLGGEALAASGRALCPLEADLLQHAALPDAGTTVRVEIDVHAFSQEGGAPVVSWSAEFTHDGAALLSVRGARSALLTPAEAATPRVSWSPNELATRPGGPKDAPDHDAAKTAFTSADVARWVDGQPGDSFGPEFVKSHAHMRSPTVPSGRVCFIDAVPAFDPNGGPNKRGYMRAEMALDGGGWYLTGLAPQARHLPASFLYEGALQVLSFYLTAMGYTVEHDGWRFEPLRGEAHHLSWAGAVEPNARLTYEVFVDAVEAQLEPTVWADVVISAGGRQVFVARRLGLRLVADNPLHHWKRLGPHRELEKPGPFQFKDMGGLVGFSDPRALVMDDGFVIDYAAMVAGAFGSSHDTYGALYRAKDEREVLPHAPSPPFQFVSRVTRLNSPLGQMKAGLEVDLEYDIPEKVWYFEENGARTMPWVVFIEVVLQCCGWVAFGMGALWEAKHRLMFRNLDGHGTWTKEILPGSGTLRIEVKCYNVSQSAGIIIQNFTVKCYLEDELIYTMDTVFGFFPKEAFENQVGLPVTPEQRERIYAPGNLTIDLTTAPAKYCSGSLRLAGKMLRMLDRIIGYWPEGGAKGLGLIRGEKDINPKEWFFKVHFFQDPVQPGSLGHEAWVQLLQTYMIEKGMGAGIKNPRFEPIMIGRKVAWKYRGQITPKNKRITSEAEILEVGTDEKGPYVIADTWLWVDGKCIYQAKAMGMRIVPGDTLPEGPRERVVERILDPAVDPWIGDHCPTWTFPALPAMSMVDLLGQATQAYTGVKPTSVTDVQVRRWLAFPNGAVKIKTEVNGEAPEFDVSLYLWREGPNAALSRYDVVATGKVRVDPQNAPRPAPFAPLDDAKAWTLPYGPELFHGPTFQLMEDFFFSPRGASSRLLADKCGVPYGAFNQGMLDACTHAVPHGRYEDWSPEVQPGQIGYPYRVHWMRFFQDLPTTGEVQLEVRFAGFDGDTRYPMTDVQLIRGGQVILEMRYVEVLLPQGPLSKVGMDARVDILRDRIHHPEVTLFTQPGEKTLLDPVDVALNDWLPGNVSYVYNIPAEQRHNLNEQVAIREHIMHRLQVHPAWVKVDDDLTSAVSMSRPYRRYPVKVSKQDRFVAVEDNGPTEHFYTPAREYWRDFHGVLGGPAEDIQSALAKRFLADIIVSDVKGHEAVRGRSCLYLANHQTGIESLLFLLAMQPLGGIPMKAVAKAEHRTSYINWLNQVTTSYPGMKPTVPMIYFEREDLASLLDIIRQMETAMTEERQNILVHVEGTRALTCRHEVKLLASSFVDLAIKADLPIVPVRFIGGLPVKPVAQRLEFPVGYGSQEYWIGTPILPGELRPLNFRARKERVLGAINDLHIPIKEEVPSAGDPAFEARVKEWAERAGVHPQFATLLMALSELDRPSEGTRRILDAMGSGVLEVDDSPVDQWLANLATHLFGPNGPRVVSR